MITLRPTALVVALALLTGCAAAPVQHAPTDTLARGHSQPMIPAPPPTVTPANDNLNAVVWTQTAIEHDMLYLQTFRDAQAQLLHAKADAHWDALTKDDRIAPAKGLKPAVVLDIDETVLDNSPYQARLIRSGGEYNEADWAAWCKEEKARALPGVVQFTQFAAKHGIAVIYVSNRAKDLDQVTLANLRKVGLPVAGPQSFLGLGTFVEGCEQVGTQKGCRRQLISQHYRVLMQFGDQLGDFVSVNANTPAGRQQAAADYLPWVGTRWFVLPNATYGDWIPALFNNDWTLPLEQRRQAQERALKYD